MRRISRLPLERLHDHTLNVAVCDRAHGTVRGFWITNWSDNPKPFVWHKSADEILDRPAAYCQRTNDSGH